MPSFYKTDRNGIFPAAFKICSHQFLPQKLDSLQAALLTAEQVGRGVIAGQQEWHYQGIVVCFPIKGALIFNHQPGDKKQIL